MEHSIDREKVIAALHCRAYDDDFPCWECAYYKQDEKPVARCDYRGLMDDAIVLLKEQEKKEIKLHKKHVLTLKRNDEFTMRKLYESICEKLLDEGEMIITRTDDYEKVEFVFYVAGE